MSLDALTLAVLRGALEEVADEMDEVLVRSAFSAVISEALDRASGLYDAEDGGVIVQGSTGLPIFIGTMQHAVKSLIDHVDPATMREGDVFIVNDPYLGGTHLLDVKLIAPFFHDGELVCFLANTGHWVDVGGGTASGFGASATSLIQEGLRIPILRIASIDGIDEGIADLIFANIRVPDESRGDFYAQLNAVRHGSARMAQLMERFGRDGVVEGFAELRRRSEEHMRSHVAAMPDGTYRCTDYLDGDGRERTSIAIELAIHKSADQLVLDFSGTEAQVAAPINLPRECAVSAAFVALKHIFPDVPINAGALSAVTFVIPEGSVLAASYPSPTAAYNETGQRVIDVVFGAMAQAVPEIAYAAPFGTAANVTIGGVGRDGRAFATYLFHGGGYGGSAQGDGIINGTVPLGIARTQPVEVLEQRFPVKFLRAEIREESAGHGKHRGGFGMVYELEFLVDGVSASVLADRALHAPFGILGGTSAAPTEITITHKGEPVKLPQAVKGQVANLVRGDRILIKTPGGGGYGRPQDRSRAKVEEDLLLGYIGIETARRIYGYD